MHYYPFNIADFSLHTAHLTLEEEAVYRRLLDYYYDTELPIPIETQRVIRRLRLVNYESVVGEILKEFFVKEGDGWHNLRADIEIADYKKKADIARENGRKGGRPKKNSASKTQSVNLANPAETGSKANQELEPLTNNHKPRTNGGRMKRPTHAELFDEFFGRVDQPQAEAEKFFSHYESNGWKVGKNPMKSWKHAVTNWITRSKENGQSNGNYTKPNPADEALYAKYPHLRPQ